MGETRGLSQGKIEKTVTNRRKKYGKKKKGTKYEHHETKQNRMNSGALEGSPRNIPLIVHMRSHQLANNLDVLQRILSLIIFLNHDADV